MPPAPPCGVGLRVARRVADNPVDEARVADAVAVADKRCRDLGVEVALRNTAAQAGDDLQILAGGMEHDLGTARDHIPQGTQVAHRQRVDDRQQVGGRQLHQAELRVVRALAHELGVQRNARGTG